eukprot:TRINITY_DN185_c0_g1_i5.p1 TRINITY_DN185_c0_g1~~TRINITY_DN185_c0_g1_i5.p1  ORF type:complete len:550 (-),score=93.59 TRINITY_DN185_c0_g1_i5:74-1684(-)
MSFRLKGSQQFGGNAFANGVFISGASPTSNATVVANTAPVSLVSGVGNRARQDNPLIAQPNSQRERCRFHNGQSASTIQGRSTDGGIGVGITATQSAHGAAPAREDVLPQTQAEVPVREQQTHPAPSNFVLLHLSGPVATDLVSAQSSWLTASAFRDFKNLHEDHLTFDEHVTPAVEALPSVRLVLAKSKRGAAAAKRANPSAAAVSPQAVDDDAQGPVTPVADGQVQCGNLGNLGVAASANGVVKQEPKFYFGIQDGLPAEQSAKYGSLSGCIINVHNTLIKDNKAPVQHVSGSGNSATQIDKFFKDAADSKQSGDQELAKWVEQWAEDQGDKLEQATKDALKTLTAVLRKQSGVDALFEDSLPWKRFLKKSPVQPEPNDLVTQAQLSREMADVRQLLGQILHAVSQKPKATEADSDSGANEGAHGSGDATAKTVTGNDAGHVQTVTVTDNAATELVHCDGAAAQAATASVVTAMETDSCRPGPDLEAAVPIAHPDSEAHDVHPNVGAIPTSRHRDANPLCHWPAHCSKSTKSLV